MKSRSWDERRPGLTPIGDLLRKPGAFERCRYHEQLFPGQMFRGADDHPRKGIIALDHATGRRAIEARVA